MQVNGAKIFMICLKFLREHTFPFFCARKFWNHELSRKTCIPAYCDNGKVVTHVPYRVQIVMQLWVAAFEPTDASLSTLGQHRGNLALSTLTSPCWLSFMLSLLQNINWCNYKKAPCMLLCWTCHVWATTWTSNNSYTLSANTLNWVWISHTEIFGHRALSQIYNYLKHQTNK